MENRFKEGDTVQIKVNPDEKMVVKRYINYVYTCKMVDDPEEKEFLYFERELLNEPSSHSQDND